MRVNTEPRVAADSRISRRILFSRISAEKYSASQMLIYMQYPKICSKDTAKLIESAATNVTTVSLHFACLLKYVIA